MPRPRKGERPMTPAERTRASRAARAARAVELPADALADAETLRRRGGDPNITAAVVRVLREAAGRPPPA